MYALATTRVSILRGAAVDDVGDEYDTGDVFATGIIAALVEKSHTVWDAATQQRRTVRYMACTVPSTTDVLTTDRIKDEETGIVYSIREVTQPLAVGLTPDLDLELVRVTSTTP